MPTYARVAVLIGLVGGVAIAVSGCCSTARCLDSRSGADRDRTQAKVVQLSVVHNDSISGPKRDRTDWKYIDLPTSGKLSVQLHWDNGGAELELAVFDVLGVKIQDGRPWGSGGLRATIAIEDPGRYYVRVRGAGKRDYSNYSLRLEFRPDALAVPCQPCTPGERKCLGAGSYIVCEQVGKNCNAWTRTVSCGSGVACVDGACAGCGESCELGARRCAGSSAYEVCKTTPAGCQSWVAGGRCGAGKRCTDGRCVRVRRSVAKPRPVERKQTVRARIISIYRYRGQMTLHIEIGDNPEVRPGQVGVVLSGDTSDPLPGGKIRISKVAGRYAIATTSLEKLGKNRIVEIKLR